MWSDNDTRIDLIDFQHLVNSAKSIVNNNDLLPCTIGLYGDWGSGKSSLMQMIESEFEDEDDVLTIKFNGWLFEGYEDAKTVLMGTILDELIKKRKLSNKGKKLASKLLKKIDWMKLATTGIKSGLGFLALGPVGLSLGAMDSGDILNKLSEADYEDYFNENSKENNEKSLRMGIREFHQDFSELLNETKVNKLIVFIDDLDRCNPSTVIDTLEAIKLFLFVKNSAFIIGADERLIKYAVKKRFPEITENERFEVGRDYLEKLIQFPIRIPQLSQSEMETYINLLFTSLGIKDENHFEGVRTKALKQNTSALFSTGFNINNFSEIIGDNELDSNTVDSIKETLAMSARITPILTRGLNGNPRQSKRFLNTLLLRIIMAESKKVDLERRVLAKLMILEYFKPELFKTLSGLQAKEEGKPKVVGDIETALKVDGSSSENKTKTKKIELSGEAENWINDPEIKEWFITEPLLKEVDLRPYFYFSRDTLGSIPAVVQRMSPKAQEAYGLLVAGSKTQRKKGLEGLADISSADLAAIFDVITNEFHEKGKTSDGESYLKILVQICEERNELIPQLFMFLKNVPHEKLPNVIIKLISAVENTKYKQSLVECLKEFSKSDNKRLSKLAKSRLSNLKP